MTRSIRTARCHRLVQSTADLELLLDTVELAEPGPGEVQVELRACAVNFPDVLMLQGKYQFRPPLPFAPGDEASGVVTRLGEGVKNLAVGDRVVVAMRYGAYSDAVNAPATSVNRLPDAMSFAQGAAFQTAYMTAYVGLVVRGGIRAGEWVMVHGATGGVGMAAVDLAKHYGARVIATGGSDDKLAVVAARGADHVINYTLPDGRLGGFRERVKEITSTGGADLILDPVGGDVFDESMRCVNFGGRILTIGFTSGRWPQAAVNLILIKEISIIGVRAGEIGRRHPEIGRANRQALRELANSGAISPHVSIARPLEEAIEVMHLMVDRKVTGKAVLTMNGYEMQT
ncbi:MAG: NADPH:quinone oxidoreductase family protein [Acidobacteriota bacterium]|nr:NADPH:quinone oxidoreductase family protein [Acidobacteriota bacterium]